MPADVAARKSRGGFRRSDFSLVNPHVDGSLYCHRLGHCRRGYGAFSFDCRLHIARGTPQGALGGLGDAFAGSPVRECFGESGVWGCLHCRCKQSCFAGWAGAVGSRDPPLFLAVGVVSVLGVERHNTVPTKYPAGEATPKSQRVALPQLLFRLRSIPEAGRFLGVLCLFTFSMFLNDAVLEPYGAAVFGMSICATTSLNVLVALGFFGGLALSGFVLIQRFGTIRVARFGAFLASSALGLMLFAATDASIPLLQVAVTFFGLSLGVCINACLTLMFSFVQPGRTGFLLGIWGAGYAYSSGLAIISGGGLLTLFKTLNGGDASGAYGVVFGLQMICFLGAAWMTGHLDIAGFRSKVRSRLWSGMEASID